MGLRVIFAGTPEFAVPTLKALLTSSHQVVGVLTQPDRPAGRGQQLKSSPVKALAVAQHLPVAQPERLDVNEVELLKPDVMVVVAYGLLLPEAVLAAPRYGCLNLHPSLLPRWRGAAPIQYTLLNGDEMTGVSVMQMDVGMDSGPVLAQEKYPVDPAENSQMLHDRLARAGATLMLATLNTLEEGAIHPVEQDASQVTYASKIKKSQGNIHWGATASKIVNQVRAFNPWPVAFTFFQGKRLRLWEAEVDNTVSDLPPGTIVSIDKMDLVVATGDKNLRILALQLPGGKVLSASDFLNAQAKEIFPGETRLTNDEGS